MFRNPVTDVIVVVVVVLLIFGPKRLPMLGRSLGQGMREFKDSITGDSKESEAPEQPALSAATASEPPAAQPAPPRETADPRPSERPA